MKAFPCEKYQIDAYGNKQPMGKEVGMDLRDYFAAKAMQGLIEALVTDESVVAYTQITDMAYKTADAMMKARQL